MTLNRFEAKEYGRMREEQTTGKSISILAKNSMGTGKRWY